jgi:hypothetical protein
MRKKRSFRCSRSPNHLPNTTNHFYNPVTAHNNSAFDLTTGKLCSVTGFLDRRVPLIVLKHRY